MIRHIQHIGHTVKANVFSGNAATKSSLYAHTIPNGLKPLSADVFTPSAQKLVHAHFGAQQSQQIPAFNLSQLKEELLAVKASPEQRYIVGKPLLDTLNEYGAIEALDHGVNQATVDKTLTYCAKVLSMPKSDLIKYLTPKISQIRGLQVKDNDPKRVFTVGSNNNIVLNGFEDLTTNGIALYKELNAVSKTMIQVLNLIYEGQEEGVLTRYAYKTNPDPNELIEDATLRQIYYPNKTKLDWDGITIKDTLHGNNVRLRPHLDYGLITVLPSSKESGLYILPHSLGSHVNTEAQARKIPLDQWIKLESRPGSLLIQIGRQMDIATKNMKHPISATWHTVLADDQQLESPRSSAAFFVENKYDPVPNYQATLDSGEHVTATASIEGSEPFEVTSLFDLMYEKQVAENNKKLFVNGRLITKAEFIEQYKNIEESIQTEVANNSNVSIHN